jgi:copper transport protein
MPVDWTVVARASVLIALIALTGGLAFNALVLRSQSTRPLREASRQHRKRWLAGCLAVAAAASVFDALVDESAGGQPGATITALAVRLATLVALSLILRGSSSESWPVVALCALLLLSRSAIGPAGREQEPVLPVLTNWLHVTFVAIWLGGVAYFAAVLVPVALTQRGLIKPLGAGIAVFSSLAILCALVIALTGIIQSASFVGSVEALIVTAYGRALLIKIGGFAVLIAFGAYHQFVVGPQLHAWRARAETQEARAMRFRASIVIEAVVGALTLIAAAWMAVLPLARSSGP